jgi:3-oxoacyl-[acyl-carrier protein] reductase
MPSSIDLRGHVALVTGASQGIGRACALALAEAGATVVAAARSEDKLAAVVQEIDAAGWHAAACKMDVASDDEIKAGAKAAIEKFGKIDILVNNAGITRDMLMMRMKRADWDAVLATNLTGAFVCTQAVIGSMLKQRWGRIVNITSINGQMGAPGQANYAASKAALIGLTMSVAREVASRNITCNAVAPGFVETAMTGALTAETKESMLKMIPLGRVGTDRDIAEAVRFLASEQASYITGHVLNVNGGLLMG